MAKQIETWPGRSVEAWFDWDWFNGEIWEITPDDVPTHTDMRSARQGVYLISKKHGIPVRTTVKDGNLYIQRKKELKGAINDNTEDRHG